MSRSSNDNGRAYEYACLQKFNERIKIIRSCRIEKNSCYYAAQSAWNNVPISLQRTLLTSASSIVDAIFDLEPLIVEDGSDTLTLILQKDSEGELGDVRDILIVRRGIRWEIGLSLKHNHLAVKHSRLSNSIDFGDQWFGVPCSSQYWSDVLPIFNRLMHAKSRGTKWSEIPDKKTQIYVPILRAFINEIKRSIVSHPEIPQKMVEYLLGRFDFYKVISFDTKSYTQIQTFNLRGTLNKRSIKSKPRKFIPVSNLPTRIVELDFKQASTTTVELYLDAGWQFSFRIHNANDKVEPSLKFDIQIIGMPATVVSINCVWH